jgi:hypothetical protein
MDPARLSVFVGNLQTHLVKFSTAYQPSCEIKHTGLEGKKQGSQTPGFIG